MLSISKLKNFDAYPKTVDDFRIKTYTGAIVSIVSGIFILWLFFSQVNLYLSTDIHHELFVDTTRGEKLKINMDVIFHHLPCAYLSLDAMDVSGEHQFDVAHNIFKKRLSSTGSPIIESPPIREDEINKKSAVANKDNTPECGSCWGAEDQNLKCCNTCDDVRNAYSKKGWGLDPSNVEQCIREGFTKNIIEQNGEGCQVYGFILVNKVAGNFHFAPGKSFQRHHMHVHDLQPFKGSFNLSHTINRLSFGNDFPGIRNPLDEVTKTELVGAGMFQYFIKVVPTIYEGLNGNRIATNQYSVTEHYRLLQAKKGEDPTGLPGLFFMYDLSPIMMKVGERGKTFSSFLTSVCAIVGGVFTVAGIFDSFIYHTSKNLKKKIDLGKTN